MSKRSFAGEFFTIVKLVRPSRSVYQRHFGMRPEEVRSPPNPRLHRTADAASEAPSAFGGRSNLKSEKCYQEGSVTQLIDVFVASPGDVDRERHYAEEAIQEVSGRTRSILNIALHPVSWHGFAPFVAHGGTRPQDVFSSRVKKSGIFIGILYERYGTEIGDDRPISGTEEEFNIALGYRDKIEILTYFREQQKKLDRSEELIRQAFRLQELQDRLRGAGLIYKKYRDPRDFRSKIVLDLFETVLRISAETERREQLRSFFRFGVEFRHENPSVVIGYPAIHKHAVDIDGLSHEIEVDRRNERSYDWQERLLPNVVYEDFKAIQKIESTVRFTGVRDISAITLDHPRINWIAGNRIWLCVPRNIIAQRNLILLKERARFKFVKDHGEPRPHIVWRSNNGRQIKIVSPLFSYLNRQKRPSSKGPWQREYGEVVARDYAVISRFQIPGTEHLTGGEPFYHYFIAGIRGLGTWGASWYIDRKPAELELLTRNSGAEGCDVQAIVEVTFSNFRVVAVRDVSSMPARYFSEQLTDATIDSVIRDYSPNPAVGADG
jgi:hypothetical protein